MTMNGGWSAPLGVHKITCCPPGLVVTVDVHRRSAPVKRSAGEVVSSAGQSSSSQPKRKDRELVLAPGKFVEVLETQVHGGRVRGRVTWEEVEQANPLLPHNSLEPQERAPDHSGKFDSVHTIDKPERRTGRRLSVGSMIPGRKSRAKSPTNSTASSNSHDGSKPDRLTIQYHGWISLLWADDKAAIGGYTESGSNSAGSSDVVVHQRGRHRTATNGNHSKKLDSGSSASGENTADEDEGPWTEPVPLGVHRINFNAGLPLRKTSDRDSQVMDILERGRYIEVVETCVKEDRVRARCIVPPPPGTGGSYQSGWISLVNAASGSSGASPVPLGAYVAVADCGCAVTEGGRLDSKVREVLVRGTCIEVVATRIEEGVVRGLVASGGHVSLFAPGSAVNGSKKDRPSTKSGSIRADGGLTFAMPVPLGTYQIIYPHGLPVTAGFSRYTPIKTKLKLDDCVEVVETRVEDGKVRGRLSAIICAAGISRGWISIFDPSCRWAKFVGRDNKGPEKKPNLTPKLNF